LDINDPQQRLNLNSRLSYTITKVDQAETPLHNSTRASLTRHQAKRSRISESQHEQALYHQKNDRLNQELNFSFNVIENDIKEIRDYLRHTRKRIEVKDVSNKNMNEWKRLALILDRFLFYSYIIVIVVSMTLMFPR